MTGPSEKQKMLAGELYYANDPELDGERRRAQRLLAQYNATEPATPAVRLALLRRLFGAVGDGADIQPRFACDYGYTIRIGRNAFINYNCVFLDCARSRSATICRWARQSSSIPRFTRSTGRPAPPGSNTRARSESATACGSAAGRSCCPGSRSATAASSAPAASCATTCPPALLPPATRRVSSARCVTLRAIPQETAMPYQTIEVKKLTPHIGAEIGGVDLSRPLGNQQFQEVHDALMENLVVFFRDQQLTPRAAQGVRPAVRRIWRSTRPRRTRPRATPRS